MAVVFVIRLVLSAAALHGELQLLSDALIVRAADPDAQAMGTIEMVGVGFATVPFAEIVFATLTEAFEENCGFEGFATLAVVCLVAVKGLPRGVLLVVVVGFAKLEGAPNNSFVTVGPTLCSSLRLRTLRQCFRGGSAGIRNL